MVFMSDKEVADLLLALRTDAMSLAEVAEHFRQRSWPDARRPRPQTYGELAAAAQEDPDPELPGSFDNVVAAYDRGEINREQYRTLVEAAAVSIRAEYESAADPASGSSE
jgi:hypothetical protein